MATAKDIKMAVKAVMANIKVAAKAAMVDIRMAVTTITMDNTIDRAIKTMVQAMDATRITMALIVEQAISVVTFGVQIRYVNVWEGICAVAFKIRRNSMGRDYDGACHNPYST